MYIDNESNLYSTLILKGSKRGNNEIAYKDVDEFREGVADAIGNKSIFTNWGQFTKDLKEGASFKIKNPVKFLELLDVLEDATKGQTVITFLKDDKVMTLIAYYLVDSVFYDIFFNRLVLVDEVIEFKPFKGVKND